MGPNSFSTQTASFANSSQRHEMSETSFFSLQLLEVKRPQNMPVGTPIAQIPVVMADPRPCCSRMAVGLTLKAYRSPLNYEKRTALSCITLNSLLLSTYQKYSFARNNIHKQYPERNPAHHLTRNVECPLLDRATPAKSYLSELSCFGSYRIVLLR